MNRNRNAFYNGMRDGVPIALGYFAVAFSLGIVAKKAGLNPFQGFISSLLNHASAGEYAEFTVIMANGLCHSGDQYPLPANELRPKPEV